MRLVRLNNREVTPPILLAVVLPTLCLLYFLGERHMMASSLFEWPSESAPGIELGPWRPLGEVPPHLEGRYFPEDQVREGVVHHSMHEMKFKQVRHAGETRNYYYPLDVAFEVRWGRALAGVVVGVLFWLAMSATWVVAYRRLWGASANRAPPAPADRPRIV